MDIKKIDKYLSFEFFRIKKAQNIEDFAKENMYSLSQIVCESNNLLPGDIVLVKDTNKVLHIVKPLETLSSIAKKYNVTIEYITKQNNIDKIFIGQQLYI